MAGEAQTSNFVLGTATVMVGPRADMYEFTPEDHSLGLVKNFTLTAEPGYTDLTQGVRNTVVYSVQTSFPVKATMEVYEYTSKNLMYGLGLDGSSYTSNPVATTGALPTDLPTTPANAWFMVQENQGTRDLVWHGQAGDTIPTTMGFTNAARIRQMNVIPVGRKDEQEFLAAKIVGILPEDNKPVTVYIPKLRIQKGFTFAMTTDNYGNMPFEFTLFDLVTADPHYALFAAENWGQAAIFVGD